MEELQAVIRWSLGFQDNSPSLSYDMTILLRDALINFVAVREEGDAELYVEKHYPELEGKKKDDKIAEVSKRIELARVMCSKLRSSNIDITEEDNPYDPDDWSNVCSNCGHEDCICDNRNW
jgi:hypothetical protein